MDGGRREDRAGRIDEKREISSRRTRSGWEEEEEGQEEERTKECSEKAAQRGTKLRGRKLPSDRGR